MPLISRFINGLWNWLWHREKNADAKQVVATNSYFNQSFNNLKYWLCSTIKCISDYRVIKAIGRLWNDLEEGNELLEWEQHCMFPVQRGTRRARWWLGEGLSCHIHHIAGLL